MVRDSHTADYHATARKNGDVMNVLLRKNLQGITKWKRKKAYNKESSIPLSV